MTDRLRLSPRHRRILTSLLRKHLPDVEVWAYGSRLNDRSHEGSDLDLVLRGPQLREIPFEQLMDFEDSMRESTIPFLVEARDWARLPERFHREIEREYVVLVDESDSSGEPHLVSRLCDHAEVVMGQSPPGATCNTSGEGMPLLNGPTQFGSHHPTPAQFTVDPRRQATAGDLLFCVRGSTAGRMNWADRDYAIGRGIAAIRHRAGPELQPFVRGVVEQSLPNLLLQATGSTFPNVSGKQLATIEWPNLGLPEQRAIAHILGTLDDKIELNRLLNETLEAITRALFKSWFVDFDPVRANVEDRNTNWPQDIADLFPDRLVDSEVGEIPEGWEVFRLDELTHHHTKSTSPFRSPELEYEHFSIPAYDADQHPAVEPGAAIRSNKTVVPADAVLLSKLNPRIARVWMPPDSTGRPQVCSTEFLAFTPRPPANRSLIFALFADQHFRALLKSFVTGTSKSHQRVPPRALKSHGVLAGSPRLFAVFGEATGDILARILKNRSEAATLATLRDTLLPKLISGEIRLAEAEGAMETEA